MSEMDAFEFPEFEFPDVLDPTTTYYPPELFDEREIRTDNTTTRFERLDDADVPLIMAKYAVLNSLDINASQEMMIGLARGERGDSRSLLSNVRKVRFSTFDSNDGFYMGDIELAADELGVLEIIWPFDEEKMQEAIEEERKLNQALREHEVAAF